MKLKAKYQSRTLQCAKLYTPRKKLAMIQPRPQGLLLVQNGGRSPGQGSKSALEFRHANTMKCLRFVCITVSNCRKQTGPPDAGNNLRKSHFIMCHVTKYSTIHGVFQQPWPGVSPTTILNEEKALGTRLGNDTLLFGLNSRVSNYCQPFWSIMGIPL